MGKKNTIGGKGYKKKKAGGAEFDRKPLEFAETGQKYALVTKMLGGCRVECKLYGGGSIANGGKGGNSGNEGVGGATGMAIGVIRGAMRKRVYINPNDVIIVSGHNLGTAEIESAFVAHPKVAEAAVVGYPHDIKGNGLYCYVTLNVGEKGDGDLERELKNHLVRTLGPIYRPEIIQFSPGLPKTRSGKIMRRILRKIAANEHDQLGDTTTLADPSVVQSLVDERKNI